MQLSGSTMVKSRGNGVRTYCCPALQDVNFELNSQFRRATHVSKSPNISCLTFSNAPAAIDFLCSAFGFERHLWLLMSWARRLSWNQLTRITAAVVTAHVTAKVMSGALEVTIPCKHDFNAERWHTCFLHLVLRNQIQFLLASILSSAPRHP